MRAICLSLFILTSALLFSSCANDTPVTTNSSNTFTGEWTVDKVQLVSAPTNGTASAMMKQALVPFGEMSASAAGNLDVTFGAETVSLSIYNLPEGPYYDMTFIGTTGYAYDFYRKKVASSIDGGTNWQVHSLPPHTGTNPPSLAAVNATTLYCVTDILNTKVFTLYKSTDMGATWVVVNTNLPAGFFGAVGLNDRLYFTDVNTGYALGSSPENTMLYKTTDGGANWSVVNNNANGFFKLHFFDSRNGYTKRFTGFEPKFAVTSDGGVTWNDYTLPAGTDVNGTEFFLNKNIGWLSNYNYSTDEFGLYKTVNGGQTWTFVTNNFVNYFVFTDENTGYAFKAEGMIFKTTNSGVDWAPIPSNHKPNIGYVKLINNKPVFFSYNGLMLNVNSSIDNNKWTAKGKITSSIIKLLTGDDDKLSFAEGDFYITNFTNITLVVNNYSEGGYVSAGEGTFYFDNGFLYITLNLPNNEVWKIKLKRK